MQKLLEKDKKRRLVIRLIENKRFILKSIFKNFNFFTLVRWNAFAKLKCLINKNSQVSLTNRCLESVSRKRLNKLTTFSRHIFLKLIRSGLVVGMRKASW